MQKFRYCNYTEYGLKPLPCYKKNWKWIDPCKKNLGLLVEGLGYQRWGRLISESLFCSAASSASCFSVSTPHNGTVTIKIQHLDPRGPPT